jgi:hypothetical protein
MKHIILLVATPYNNATTATLFLKTQSISQLMLCAMLSVTYWQHSYINHSYFCLYSLSYTRTDGTGAAKDITSCYCNTTIIIKFPQLSNYQSQSQTHIPVYSLTSCRSIYCYNSPNLPTVHVIQYVSFLYTLQFTIDMLFLLLSKLKIFWDK